MKDGFLPRGDAALLAWSANFSTRISAAPLSFGLSAALASAYATVHASYASALALCEPGVRNKSSVYAKRDAASALRAKAGYYSKLIQGTATVTDSQKADLGLNVKAPPSPIPAPTTSPEILIQSVAGNVVKVRLKGTTTARGGKPAGVVGATVFSYVGATPPANIDSWKFEGSSGKTKLSIAFPISAEPFSKVWVTAFWKNGKDQSGPACTPVTTNLGTWLVQAALHEEEPLRVAA